jgi:hypothetical protein
MDIIWTRFASLLHGKPFKVDKAKRKLDKSKVYTEAEREAMRQLDVVKGKLV